ncbi:hypothetical protein Tsedi_00532 [Tepidimonas sediminis]|uniref:DUF4160 domain-containing protein n=1 Tax=Tepidimonas sediminis TaxID=2588941 RepID=A0A554WTC8_9BURK|nr:hypothetical protein Tsedi_00532 [Tepidimonas sediminis]
MASIRHGSLRLVVYPNDHEPPHAHVIGAGWEVRVALSCPPGLLTVAGRPKAGEGADALLAVEARLSELRQLWSELHG